MSGLVGLRYSLRALGGRMGSEWERERRDTLFLMGAIALAVLPQMPFFPVWIPIAFAVMFCWRLAIVFSGRPLPSLWIRVAGAATCLAAILAQYQTLLGREQGVAMLTLFLGLKLLEMKARRDLFVVIFLCFFLLLTAFFNSQSALTAGLIFFAVTALVASMITMQFSHRETGIAVRFRYAFVMLLQAIPIAVALFVLFPRLATPLWGFQGDSAASTGLSNSMSPGGVADLSKSSQVVLRARFDKVPPASQQRYWRGPVFGHFDGRTWTTLRDRPKRASQAKVQIGNDSSRVDYEVTIEPAGNRWLLALDMVTLIEPIGAGRVMITPDFTLELDTSINSRLRYSLTSHLSYQVGGDDTVEQLRPWLALPRKFNPRTAAMTREWRQDPALISSQDYVQRALRMFNEQPFSYTLQPPLLGEHSVDEFLFDKRAGFCEHFTSSFVVLMRLLGIPARVVTGYQGGEINPVNGAMIVRQSDAHAWAEVWHAQSGWVRVDPTAAVAPERIQTSQRLYSEADVLSSTGPAAGAWNLIKFNLDALTNHWNQWVLNFDRGSQKRLLDRLGMDGDDWYGLAGLLAAAMTLLIGGSALLTLQPRPPKDPTGNAYDAFCVKLAAQGIVREPYETPQQFLKRVARDLEEPHATNARHIVVMYTRLRYGSLSSVYIGQERRKTARERVTQLTAKRIGLAKDGLRTLRRAVKAFAP